MGICIKKVSIVAILALILGCISVGTHGSIEAYKYPVAKSKLQDAVRFVINHNKFIKQDALKDYYNNDSVYISFQIVEPGISNSYTIRFYGWNEGIDSSANSSVSIAYAFDDLKHRGGSEGNGGVKWYNVRLRKTLIGIFEQQFINKVDSQLKRSHIKID